MAEMSRVLAVIPAMPFGDVGRDALDGAPELLGQPVFLIGGKLRNRIPANQGRQPLSLLPCLRLGEFLPHGSPP
jgi:hypothetical protein